MAISFVGQAGIGGVNNTSPQSITYTSTAGNALIITGHLYDDNNGVFVAPTSVTDTAGNVWQISVNSAQTALTVQTPPLCSILDPSDGASSHQADWIAWCVNATPVTSVTVAWEGGVLTWNRIALSEWSGIVQFDNSWAGGSSTASSSVTSGPVQLNNNNELVVGALDIAVGAGGQTLPTSWTGFTAGAGDLGYYLPGTTGAYSPVWTGGNAGSWAGALAVFSPQALNPATTVTYYQMRRIGH